MAVSNQGKRIIIISALIFVALIVGISIYAFIQRSNSPKETSVTITNLDDCSENMKLRLQELMDTTVYRYIKEANDYNKKETAQNYTATIRDNSCKEGTTRLKDGGTGFVEVKETTAILDIPDAQQSWDMLYYWQPENDERMVDLGEVATLKCLPDDKLIYEPFNCASVISKMKFGTDKADPILEYMPYTGAGFNLTYKPDTREVAAEITLRGSQMNNEELKTNLRAQVEYWFTKRNLDIATYTVTYSYTNLDETGNTLPPDYVHYGD